jgi:hypothetical protein
MLDLYNYSLLTIFLAGLALIVAASEIGRLTGAARAEAARRKEFVPNGPWRTSAADSPLGLRLTAPSVWQVAAGLRLERSAPTFVGVQNGPC